MKVQQLFIVITALIFLSLPSDTTAQWRSIGPNGGKITTLVVDPTNPAMIYAGTNSGVFKSENGGGSWRFIGPANREISALAISSARPTTIYAATTRIWPESRSGVYRSDNGGATWVDIRAGLDDPRFPPGQGLGISFSIHTLVADPHDPEIIWAGAFDHQVLFVSSNRGASWKPSSPFDGSMRAMVFDPRDSKVIFAGVKCVDYFFGSWCNNLGVHRSGDGGATWTQLPLGLKEADFGILHVTIAADGRTLLALSEKELFKSSDGGASWSTLRNAPVGGGRTDVAIDPTNSALYYLTTFGGGVYRSIDGGSSWAHLVTPFSCPQSPFENTYLEATAISIDQIQPGRLWIGTEEDGVFVTSDSGSTWHQSNQGLIVLEALSLAVDPAHPESLWVATHGNGVKLSSDRGTTWSDASGGLCNVCDPAFPMGMLGRRNILTLKKSPGSPALFAGTENGLRWSMDGGMNWQLPVETWTSRYMQYLQAIAVDSTNPNSITAGTNLGELFHSSDAGVNWSYCIGGSNLSGIMSLALLPGDQPKLLIASRLWMEGHVYSANSACPERAELVVAADLANLRVYTLTPDPRLSDHIFAGTSDGVFTSFDGGINWRRLGLEGIDVRTIAISPVTSQTLWVGTAGSGVFSSTDGGATWKQMNDGLFAPNITALIFEPFGGTIYAATAGNSVFALDLPGRQPRRRLQR